MEGYISLFRKLQSNPIWYSEPFTRGQAWVDLLLLANYKDGYLRIAGEKIDIKRGQLGYSQLTLSKRWRWSRGKTKRFLKELQSDKKIDIKQNNRTTIITICNYCDYQTKKKDDDTTDGTTDGHQMVQQTDINNKDNKDNKDNKVRAIRLHEYCLKNLSDDDLELFKRKPLDCMPDEMIDLWKDKIGDTDKMWVEWEKFYEYFMHNKDCRKPARKDWLGTWRNWITK